MWEVTVWFFLFLWVLCVELGPCECEERGWRGEVCVCYGGWGVVGLSVSPREREEARRREYIMPVCMCAYVCVLKHKGHWKYTAIHTFTHV